MDVGEEEGDLETKMQRNKMQSQKESCRRKKESTKSIFRVWRSVG